MGSRWWRRYVARAPAAARGADASSDTATYAAGTATEAADTAETAASEAGDGAERSLDEIANQVAAAARETDQLVEQGVDQPERDPAAGRPGTPFDRRSPFYIGFVAALGVLTAYGLVHLVLQLKHVFTYIVLALFLSLGLDPIVAAMNRRRGIRRGWAVLMVVGGVACIFALIGWVIVPPVVTQTAELVKNAPDYVKQIEHNHFVMQIDHRWHVTTRAQDAVQKRGGALFGGLLGAGKVIFDGIVGALTVLVLTLYFLATMPRVKSAAYQLIPRPRRPRVVYLSEEIARRVGGYVLGQLCVATINGALSYVILAILGIPLAAVLAVLVGLLALVPIIGTLIGGALVTLVALTSSWQEALIVLGYYILYHIFEAYILAPRIMRRAVEVPPALTIVAILAGGALLGVLGALISIPVAAGLLLIYEQVIVPRQQRA